MSDSDLVETLKSLSDPEFVGQDDEKSITSLLSVVSLDPDAHKNNNNGDRIKVVVRCSSGSVSSDIFKIGALKQLKYFENQLSDRWNFKNEQDSQINVSCNGLNKFDVTHIRALLYCKTHNQLPADYPCNELPKLCHAGDFFADSISCDIFYSYFIQRIPSIKSSEVAALSELCISDDCKSLVEAIDQYATRMNDVGVNMIQTALQNWKSAALKVLVSSTDIAKTIFHRHFKIIKSNYVYVIDFTQHRSVSDLSALWQCIKYKGLIDAEVRETVVALKDYVVSGQGFYSHIALAPLCPQMTILLRIMALDVIDSIFLTKVVDLKKTYIGNMVQNIFSIIKLQKYEKKSAIHGYDFLMSIILKLLEWRSKEADLYNMHCSKINIVRLLSDRLHIISSGASKRNFLGDVKKMSQQLGDCEQMELLRLLLSNFNKMKLNKRELRNVIKLLIEMNYAEAFKLTDLWFPLFMKTHRQWIMDELPTKNSMEVLEGLLQGIWKYVVSEEYETNPCDAVYIEFINEYTGNDWKIN